MIISHLCKWFVDLLGPEKLQARFQENKHSEQVPRLSVLFCKKAI